MKKTSDLDRTVAKYMPFLMEIRKRVIFVISVFLIAGILGFAYYEKIISTILIFFRLEGINIVFTSPFQFINLAITSGFFIGFVVILPLLVQQLLSFLRPALRDREYHIILRMLPLSFLLFLGGFAFGIVTMRYVIQLFYTKSTELQIGNILDVSVLLTQTIATAILMGVSFQYPIVLSVLMIFKIVRYRVIRDQRIIAYGLSIAFAALLPPTDLLSLIILSLPLIILFELTLLLNRYYLKVDLT